MFLSVACRWSLLQGPHRKCHGVSACAPCVQYTVPLMSLFGWHSTRPLLAIQEICQCSVLRHTHFSSCSLWLALSSHCKRSGRVRALPLLSLAGGVPASVRVHVYMTSLSCPGLSYVLALRHVVVVVRRKEEPGVTATENGEGWRDSWLAESSVRINTR